MESAEQLHGHAAYEDPLDIPALACGAMAASKPYVATPAHQAPLGFPGELVENWQEKAILKLGDLVKNNRALRVYLDACVRCGACTDKCHYFMGTGDPEEYAGRAPEPDAQGLPPLFHARREGCSLACRRGRPHPRGARRVVQLFPSVLAVPALLGLLPLWHRHRRNLHGRPRDHGLDRHGAEILQRDHRQGLQCRQQSRPAAQGAEEYA